MNLDIPIEPPPAYTRGDATFAQVAKDFNVFIEINSEFQEALDAFRQFISSQERDRLSKHQLKLLRSQAAYTLEECAKYRNTGGDLSAVLPKVTQILTGLSEELEQGPRWDQAIADPSVVRRLESTIGDAFDRLEDQMRKMVKGDGAESTMYKDELERARENDRRKIEELEAAIRELKSSPSQTPNEVVQNSMEENLKIIRDPSAYIGQRQIDARKALAVIAELTGKSLPPNTILDKQFVTIGNNAINQGSSYDVFVGEYFTGEKIAVKVLRHRVDEATARKTLERFARLTENWAALRHDCILPFYGVGVMPSPVSPTEYQLYLVSPYLKNQDIKRHLKAYQSISKHARLQMVLEIARGLKYMHGGDDLEGVEGEGMVHSALNIFNVLVKDSGRAVISGLGHTKVVKDFQAGASFTGDNSEYRYMGPEILDDAVLTSGSDIWSWAMTSLEILTDEPPFGAETRGTKIIQMIGANQRPERISHPRIEEYEGSDEIWQLFEDCWHKQPEDRPTARQVVQRVKSIVRVFDGKSEKIEQKPPPLINPRTEHRRSAPRLQQSTQLQPGQKQPGRATQTIALGQLPLSDTEGGPGEGSHWQDGKVSRVVESTLELPEGPGGHVDDLIAIDDIVLSADRLRFLGAIRAGPRSNSYAGVGETSEGTKVPVIKVPTYTRGKATFAHVLSELSKLIEIGPDFGDALQAFRLFLEAEESVTIGRQDFVSLVQLRVLRAQAVYILEEYARCRSAGGDLSQALPVFIQTLYSVSEQIKLKGRWNVFVKKKVGLSKVEVVVDDAFETLVEQLEKLEKLTGYERSNRFLDELDLERAQKADRNKVEIIEAAAGDHRYTGPSFRNLDKGVKPLIDHCLALMSTTTEVGQQETHTRQALAAIAELSGESVPLVALENEHSIETETRLISRSAAYDVFVGEYFTGQEVAIKIARYQTHKELASAACLRFSRLRENWTSLRHDCIHPLYGLGIMQPLTLSTKYRLYFVSPYLQNQNASTYLQTYPMTPESSRLQMVLDIAQGLKYMHFDYILPDGNGVVHHALNIYNVLVKDSGRAAISGFGCNDLLKNVPLKRRDYESYRYMGPESLDDGMSEHHPGSDIWSWAMTSLEILTGEPPFNSIIGGVKNPQELHTRLPERVAYPKIEEYECRDEIWKLLEDSWKRTPEDRPSAKEIVERLRSLVNNTISRHMSATEILRRLSENNYPDITAQIDEAQCTNTPINGGGNGDIYQGFLANGPKVAIKCPRGFNIREQGCEALKEIAKEGYQWSNHQHLNVLEIFGLALFRNQIALVSPWMENGTTLNYLEKHPEADRIKLCSQVAHGLAYIHSKETIHGDLKARNVLVSQDGIAKIIDFGSTVMNHYSLKFTGEGNDHLFTVRYAAPELLQDSEASVGKPTKKSDVYALSMTILEIVTGKVPFEDIRQNFLVCTAVCGGRIPQRPDNCIPSASRDGAKLWNLLKRGWQFDPDNRPTASEVEIALSEITQEGLIANNE